MINAIFERVPVRHSLGDGGRDALDVRTAKD